MSIALRPLCGLLITLYAAAPAAQVYLCPDDRGRAHYQQTPCPGSDAGPVALPPLNTLGGGLRPGERELLESRRKQAERARRTRDARRARTAAGDLRRERQARSCWQREQRLGRINARLRRGYTPTQGIRLRDRRRELEDYLRRFCR